MSFCLVFALAGAAALAAAARAVEWADLPVAIQKRLSAGGLAAGAFPAFLRDHDQRTAARVREGDLDALIYYALQSTSFTGRPPIEPAIAARTFVDALEPATRERFLAGQDAPVHMVPADVKRRITGLAVALGKPSTNARLAYFRDVVATALPSHADSPAARADLLIREYMRAMRFLYQKEFVARKQAGGAETVAALYRERGLSTDTAVEAGYLIHIGLATLHALEPARRVRRVLVIGPGLDFSPRTGLLEAGPPESYQPYAVIDSLVSLGLSRLGELTVVGADVNPRVVDHLQRARTRDVVLTLLSGVGESDALTLDEEYRRYFAKLGAAIGRTTEGPAAGDRYGGHLKKSVEVRRDAASAVDGALLDIVSRRLDGERFDLAFATNIFPYLDDRSLTLALTNVAAMLAPGGVLLHNEARPLVAAAAEEAGLPFERLRTAVIAKVRGAPPLSDAVFVHVKR